MEMDVLGFFREWGLPGLIVGFYLLKDWRLTSAQVAAANDLAAALSALKTVIELQKR